MPEETIKIPVRYDGDSQILDADRFLIADIRGWGRLSSLYGADAAAIRQDEVGEYIAKCINEHADLETRLTIAVTEREGFRGQIEEWQKHLNAARHALRSYQYGNSSPTLAEQTADAIDNVLNAAFAEADIRGIDRALDREEEKG